MNSGPGLAIQCSGQLQFDIVKAQYADTPNFSVQFYMQKPFGVLN